MFSYIFSRTYQKHFKTASDLSLDKMNETLKDCYSRIYLKVLSDPERELILERIPLIIGYGVFIGLQKFSRTLPKHITRVVTRKNALRYFQDIYVDFYGMRNLSEVFVEQSLSRFFHDVTLS